MDAIQNLMTRRSVKKFKPDMVPADILDKIIKAGTNAPSGMNRQSSIILAVTNKQMRDKLSRMNAAVMGSNNDPFYGAPVVLVVLADKSIGTYKYDGSLVMGNLLNAAHALGVSSCWIHRAKEVFDSAEGKQILYSLGIVGDYEGIGNCILGYADCDIPAAKERKKNYVYFIK